MTYLIDSHQDIACAALSFNRDYLQSAYEIRKQEKGSQIPIWNKGEATLGWPEYQAGKVALIFSTLFAAPAKYSGGDWDYTYKNAKEFHKLLSDQISYYQRLNDEHPDHFRLIRNKRDLVEILTPWETDKPGNHAVGLVLLIEGPEGLQSPEQIIEFYERGVFQVGPVWAGTRFCGGTKEDRPFDKEGKRLLEIMSSLGIALDISHMREDSALTALDMYEGPVFASHANAKALLKGTISARHVSDQVIRRLFERGGVIGAVPYNLFLSTKWGFGSPREMVTIKDYVAQIDYYCQMSGNSTLVGVGTDFDGGFGYPNIPLEFETIADLQKIKAALSEMGYTANDIENIFHNNWKRHLENILPE